MKLPEITQVAFQGAAQGLPFAPVQVPDPNPGLQAKLATIASSFQNMETSGVQEYKRQEQSAKQMQQLYEFAPKALQEITGLAIDVQDTLAKQAVASSLWKLKDSETRLKKSWTERWNESVQQQNEVTAEAAPHAQDLARQGMAEQAGFMVEATGRRAVYRDIELAKFIPPVLAEWVSDQRKNNTGKMFIEGYGQVTINDPNLPETVSDMIINNLTDAAMGIDEISGKASIPMDILGKHAFPLLRQNLGIVKQRFHKEIRSRRGESQRRDLIRQFNIVANDKTVDPKVLGQNFFNTINMGAATTPISGENFGIGPGAMRKLLKENIVEAVKGGMPFDLDRFGDAVLPNGKLVRDEYDGFFMELSNDVKDARTQGFKNRRAAGQASVIQRVQAFGDEIRNNPGKYSADDLSRFTAGIVPEGQKYGMSLNEMGVLNLRSTLLQFGVGADERAPMIQSAIDDFTSGKLRDTHPLYRDELGRTHWTYEFAKKNSKEQDTPQHEAIKETVQGLIGEEMSSAKTLYGDILGTGKQMTNWWMRKIQPELKYDLANAKTEEDLAGVITKYSTMAKNEIPKAFKKGSGHIFELNDAKRPFRWESRPETKSTAFGQLQNQLAHLTDVAKSGGDLYRELHNNPSSFAATDRILAVLPKLQNFEQLPSEYTLGAKLLNEAAGKTVFKNGMHIYGTLLRSVAPDLYKSSNFEQLAQQYNQMPSKNQQIVDRHLAGEYVNWKSSILPTNAPGRGSFEGNLPATVMTDDQIRRGIRSIIRESPGSQTKGVDIVHAGGFFPAYFSGVVKSSGEDFRNGGTVGFGYYTVIEHRDPATGMKFDGLYSHLAEPSPLKPGQMVSAGQIVGKQGSTGRTVPTGTKVSSFDALKAQDDPNSKDMTPYQYADALVTAIIKRFGG